jgi:hypothetical protein
MDIWFIIWGRGIDGGIIIDAIPPFPGGGGCSILEGCSWDSDENGCVAIMTSIPEMALTGLLAMTGFFMGTAQDGLEASPGAVGADMGDPRKSNEPAVVTLLALWVLGMLLLSEKTPKSSRGDDVDTVVEAAFRGSAAVVDELNASKGGMLFVVVFAVPPKGSKSSIVDVVVVVAAGTDVENASNAGAADEVWNVPKSSSTS